jgi:hypothetical protein
MRGRDALISSSLFLSSLVTQKGSEEGVDEAEVVRRAHNEVGGNPGLRGMTPKMGLRPSKVVDEGIG